MLQCLVAAVHQLEVKNLDTEGIPRLNLGWWWEDQEEAVMLACSTLVTWMMAKGCDSIFALFRQEILPADRLAELYSRCLALSYLTRGCAYNSCLGVLL